MVNASFSRPWADRVALITGASSGIGAATARLLASRGLRVLLVARRRSALEQLAAEIDRSGGRAEVLPADLSQEAARKTIYREVTERHAVPDVLVNNAGFGWYGYYADMPWETARRMIAVNTTAIAQLTSSFLPLMRANNRGHIINVGSIAGGLPSQGIALYAATKSFLDAFTTALHREMRGTPVRLSVVRPGPVISEFFDRARKLPAGRPLPSERFAVPASLVAERIWHLLRHPRRFIYVPWALRFSPWIETGFGWLIDRLGPLLLRKPR